MVRFMWYAGVAKLAYAADSKSVEGNLMWVQVPPPAQKELIMFQVFCNNKPVEVGEMELGRVYDYSGNGDTIEIRET